MTAAGRDAGAVASRDRRATRHGRGEQFSFWYGEKQALHDIDLDDPRRAPSRRSSARRAAASRRSCARSTG